MELERVDAYRVRIRKKGNMRVPGMIYADQKLLDQISTDRSADQVANVAHLPGIVRYSLAMPDIHWGYGFPIGGVAAFDMDNGVISPGGVGYDINCGVRLLSTTIPEGEIRKVKEKLVNTLFSNIPCGLGSSRKDLKLKKKEAASVAEKGARWAVEKGFGTQRDLRFTEENGCLEGASFHVVSERAFERGRNQLGTLGSGNHFIEVGYVDEIFDTEKAATMGLHLHSAVVTLHTGSRGFGYQICDDSISKMMTAVQKYGIALPDRQLCCAPLRSREAKDYFAAMASAANFAFGNRQIITHWIRESFASVFGDSPQNMGLNQVYDVTHNIAKFETHTVEGQKKKLCVHRKGATRAFPPGHPEIPDEYRAIGQPVLVPGDMGRYSYVMTGTEQAAETFYSCCHGAGRVLSRSRAKKIGKGRAIERELADVGIYVRHQGKWTLKEEMPEAYKDVSDVVDVVHKAGLAVKVAKLVPLGVIKG